LSDLYAWGLYLGPTILLFPIISQPQIATSTILPIGIFVVVPSPVSEVG